MSGRLAFLMGWLIGCAALTMLALYGIIERRKRRSTSARETNGSPEERVRAVYNRLADLYDRFRLRFDRKDIPVVLDLLRLSETERILDVGTGTGIYPFAIRRRGYPNPVTGIDIADRAVAVARKKAAKGHIDALEFDTGDMQGLPYPNESFDRVICVRSLLLVPDTRRAAAEFFRVLTSSGIAIVVEPLPGKLRRWKRFLAACRYFCPLLSGIFPELRGVNWKDLFWREEGLTPAGLRGLFVGAGFGGADIVLRNGNIYCACWKPRSKAGGVLA